MGASIYDFDTTAANNTSVDGISQAENVMRPPAVNNAFRALDAILARFCDDLGAVNTVGGTADAITVTLSSGITAYATGQIFRFVAASANTGAATINVNGIGAKAIRKISGGADAALAAGDLAGGETYLVVYRASANSAAGAWVLVGAGGVTRASLGLDTTDSPQFAGLNIGAATDTTLSRGAAGFVAVEGNRVPSPASQAEGDILYRGSTEWERLPKGTASQVLQMNSGATAPEWATPASGGQPIPTNSSFAVGTFMMLKDESGGTISNGSSVSGSVLRVATISSGSVGTLSTPSGTWKNIGGGSVSAGQVAYFVRTA